jgi:D-serine dehydratase
VAEALAADPGLDLYCLADSLAAVDAMTRELGTMEPPLRVLVELGVAGARTGARSVEDAEEVARAVAASPSLELAGVEGFEGIIQGDDAIPRTERFLDDLRALLLRLDFGGREPIVTAGGSIFFDLVCERLAGVPARIVVRSGCYLTHDTGYYEELSPLGGRSHGGEQLENALEIWGAVLSRPEPDIAIVLMGKRDVAYDLEPPIPLRVHGPGGLRSVRGSMSVYDLNDQHAYVRVPADDPLAVGDLLACGVSHPCTAFDKWRLVPIVDDAYTVVDAVHTFF